MKTKYEYPPGTVRWRRHNPNEGDVRGVRIQEGWEAEAMMIGNHPINGRPFKNGAQWWFREVKE